MNLFDAHTHIQFPAYDDDREDAILRAKKAGVKMLAVGTQYETSVAGVSLAKKHPGDIWAVVGFHPNHAVPSGGGAGDNFSWYHDPKEQKHSQPEKFDAARFAKLAEDPKVVAIGECGLDYYRLPSEKEKVKSIKDEQARIFSEQVKIAQSVGKPLMIHARPSAGTDDAYEDTLSVIARYPEAIAKNISEIFHFYSGSFAMTKKLVEAGCYFTFGGVITFAREFDDILAYIPLDRIMLETDAPYVAPAPYRGSRNEPAYVVETAKKLAELTHKTFEEICEITTANVQTVFGIK